MALPASKVKTSIGFKTGQKQKCFINIARHPDLAWTCMENAHQASAWALKRSCLLIIIVDSIDSPMKAVVFHVLSIPSWGRALLRFTQTG